jgi:hypothetical protein
MPPDVAGANDHRCDERLGDVAAAARSSSTTAPNAAIV